MIEDTFSNPVANPAEIPRQDKTIPKRELSEAELHKAALTAMQWVKEGSNLNSNASIAYAEIADDLRYRLLVSGTVEEPEKSKLERWLIDEVAKVTQQVLLETHSADKASVVTHPEKAEETLAESSTQPTAKSVAEVPASPQTEREPEPEIRLSRILHLLNSFFKGRVGTSNE